MSVDVAPTAIGPAAPATRSAVRAAEPAAVVTLVVLVQTAASLGSGGLALLGPALVAELDLTRAQLGLLATAVFLGAGLALPFAGQLSDRYGARRPFALALGLCGAGLALAAAASGLAWLLAAVVVYGLGYGAARPPAARAIADWVPPHRRGIAMGLTATGASLAGLVCGWLVPPVVDTVGWRAVLAALGMATAGAAGLAWLGYRDGEPERSTVRRVAALGHALRDRRMRRLCAATCLQAGAALSTTAFLVLFLRERIGLGLGEAGALFALAHAAGTVGRVGWGVLGDGVFGGRYETALAVVAGLAAAATLALGAAGAHAPPSLLWVLIFAVGATALGWNGLSSALAMRIAGRSASATASGLNLVAFSLGAVVFPPLFGVLVDATGSYGVAFLANAAASLAAVLLIVRLDVAPAASMPRRA
jgi:ACS family hexuronate transporter-like MFS transporter